MKIIKGEIIAEPGEHVVLTGPINGNVVLSDGTQLDVSPIAVVAPEGKAAEVAHLIGLRYGAEGHPEDPPDEPFAYDVPKKFAKYTPHPDNPDSIAPSTEA